MRVPLHALGAALATCTWACIAQAHSHLKKAVPAPGSTVASTLPEIRLQFDEFIEARLSSVRVESKTGVAIRTEPVASEPTDKNTLIVRLSQPLTVGTYKVRAGR